MKWTTHMIMGKLASNIFLYISHIHRNIITTKFAGYHAIGLYTMLLSYCHAAIRLIDPIITYGTATGPRQGTYNAVIILSCRGHVDGSHDYIWNHNRSTAGNIQCRYHIVMPRPC